MSYGICDANGSQLDHAYASLDEASVAAQRAATRYRCRTKVYEHGSLRDVAGPFEPQDVPRDANGYPLD